MAAVERAGNLCSAAAHDGGSPEFAKSGTPGVNSTRARVRGAPHAVRDPLETKKEAVRARSMDLDGDGVVVHRGVHGPLKEGSGVLGRPCRVLVWRGDRGHDCSRGNRIAERLRCDPATSEASRGKKGAVWLAGGSRARAR